jgi:hypothetical protein
MIHLLSLLHTAPTASLQSTSLAHVLPLALSAHSIAGPLLMTLRRGTVVIVIVIVMQCTVKHAVFTAVSTLVVYVYVCSILCVCVAVVLLSS